MACLYIGGPGSKLVHRRSRDDGGANERLCRAD